MSILADILEHIELTPSQLLAYIDDYETVQPYDCMIDTARAVVTFYAQDYAKAEKWILRALRKNPVAHQNHLYHALIAKALGKYAVSVKECYMAVQLANQAAVPPAWKDEVKQINCVLDETLPLLSQEELTNIAAQRNILSSPGLLFPAYYLCDQKRWSVFQNAFLYQDCQKQYNDFVCVEKQSYIDSTNWFFQKTFAQSEDFNAYTLAPAEIWKARKVTQYNVAAGGYIFAVAGTVPGQKITISSTQGEPVHIALNVPFVYHYVNMDEAGLLQSAQEFIISKAIPCKEPIQKKKLVLFINVNSISQAYLSQTDFAAMPYTKNFFAKGTIFRNCYSTSEGSHPSESSLHTGLYTTNHHVIYRSSACQFPPDIQTASEHFNQEGYFTALVSGSVGSSPYIGGLRGFDCAKRRVCMGYADYHLVEDVLCFMEAFPKTSQYISVGLFAPHTSVEPEFDGSFNPSMPRQTTLGFRSLYGPRCPSSIIEKYEAALNETDRELNKIYDYILSHYAEDEYVICLCSEHGTSDVADEKYLLQALRTNTVLMLCGGGIPAGISEEYINHIDYLPILTKLAGMNVDFSQHDCVLPRTFGGSGRDYVYTESIYQGQTYKAAVRTDEFECRFESNAHTNIDGLIDLSQGYVQKIFSIQTGEEIQDSELAEDFEAIVLDHIKETIKY